MQIKIELQSDTAPGTGEGRAGEVDLDLVYDEDGLPLIPARRLKGCLREAALEVQEALNIAGYLDILKPEILKSIFGSPYSEPSQPGCLRISDAVLEQAEELKPWLKWAAAKDTTIFGSGSILDTFTGTRSQTSISRTTGGPLANSLRISRVIRKGYVFTAQAYLVDASSQSPEITQALMRQGLALACTALRHIGHSRNRGLGLVKVSLTDEVYTSEQALMDLEKRFATPGGKAK